VGSSHATERNTGTNSRSHWKIAVAAIVGVAVFGTWILGGGFFWNRQVLSEATEFLMDTSVAVKVYAGSRKEGAKIIDAAFAEARRIEQIMEPQAGDGELARLNGEDGLGPYRVSGDLAKVLSAALEASSGTDGAFDPTIGPVKWLWRFDEEGGLPPHELIAEAMSMVDAKRVELSGDSLRLTVPDVKLDLGGAAKGYVVDRMIDVLRDGGAEAALVNAGGDIRSFGMKPGEKRWVIGVRHPRLSRTLVMESMALNAVATSGDYERYLMVDGVRYHHILDPRTGYPAHDCISVTVWARNAMHADVLATAVFVMGPERGLAYAERADNVEALIFYERDGALEAALTSGVEGKITL
jgi:FAD:protein FMN transferase